MKNKFIGPAGDQRHYRNRKRNGGRRHNWERTLGRKTISFSVESPVFNLLKATAESRKLRLPGFIRNIVFEWAARNL